MPEEFLGLADVLLVAHRIDTGPASQVVDVQILHPGPLACSDPR